MEHHERQEQQTVRAMPKGGNGQAGRPKTLNEIQQELDATRTEMSATLEAIASRMSPEALTDRAMEYFRFGGGEFARNMGGAVGRNPLPVALTGIGLAWLMWSDHSANAATGSGGPGMAEKMSSAGEATKERYSQARENASAAYGHAQEQLDRGRHAAGEMAHRAGRMSAQWGAGAQRWFDEQPLAIGALGIGLGALLGAAVPRSRKEAQAMEPLAEQARKSASHVADDVTTKASEAVSQSTADTGESAMEHLQSAGEEASAREEAMRPEVVPEGGKEGMPPGH